MKIRSAHVSVQSCLERYLLYSKFTGYFTLIRTVFAIENSHHGSPGELPNSQTVAFNPADVSSPAHSCSAWHYTLTPAGDNNTVNTHRSFVKRKLERGGLPEVRPETQGGVGCLTDLGLEGMLNNRALRHAFPHEWSRAFILLRRRLSHSRLFQRCICQQINIALSSPRVLVVDYSRKSHCLSDSLPTRENWYAQVLFLDLFGLQSFLPHNSRGCWNGNLFR